MSASSAAKAARGPIGTLASESAMYSSCQALQLDVARQSDPTVRQSAAFDPATETCSHRRRPGKNKQRPDRFQDLCVPVVRDRGERLEQSFEIEGGVCPCSHEDGNFAPRGGNRHQEVVLDRVLQSEDFRPLQIDVEKSKEFHATDLLASS